MVNNIDVEFFVGYGLVKNPTEIYYHQTPLVLSVSDKKTNSFYVQDFPRLDSILSETNCQRLIIKV